MKVGEGEGGRDMGRGAADDDCELMLEVPKVVGVLDTLVLSAVLEPAVAVSELVGTSELVGGAELVEVVGVEICWVSVDVGGEVSLDVGVMGRIDPGREIEIDGWVKEEETGGGGSKVGIARRPGADIADGTAEDMSQCRRDASLEARWSGNGETQARQSVIVLS